MNTINNKEIKKIANLWSQKGLAPTHFVALFRQSRNLPTGQAGARSAMPRSLFAQERSDWFANSSAGSEASRKRSRGFTLIEMIVSIGLFTVVVFVAIGSLTGIVTASKKVQSIKIVMDNLNFAVDSMVRQMRTGRIYHCGTSGDLTTPNDCPSIGSSSMAFRTIRGKTYAFRISNGRLQRSEDGGSTYLDMTAPELNINSLQFYVRGSVDGDGFRPRILVIIEGTAGVKTVEKTTFRIQTTISQRFINS